MVLAPPVLHRSFIPMINELLDNPADPNYIASSLARLHGPGNKRSR